MRTRSESVRSLDTLLTTAASSLAVPYTVSKGESIRETVCKKMDAEGVQHEVVGCKAPSADLAADVKAALAKGSASAPNVVIVCSNVAPEQEGTAAGLAAEVEQLQTVQAAVASAGDHVVVYASQPKPEAAQAGGARRRSLVTSFTGFGAYTSCGTLCQTQVRWLEGMVAMLVLALASCAGLVCLYVLDTPTRFETPKDAAPAQS
ncbi:hypothetical protein HYH03_015676 [Edaphochlamys debaryana]|uniref:Uncharacterized protein n=1 Tax=Edaphochlamys debaryana TaxID=47281 RepID=A0A835XK69_9CHLO|nr:hypothetical protein HYH03_015676 [Edaphochlamys debaryana]|eukprot:KAG2485613.1 hypothetical protein HYH03_015676 [Edaphochlamys debaryana]